MLTWIFVQCKYYSWIRLNVFKLTPSTIIDKFKGGPVGLSTLATAVSENAETIEEVYEPFLIQEGFIYRTPRGREVTEKAYQHLGRTNSGKLGDLFNS